MVFQDSPTKWRNAGAAGPLATRRFHISTAVRGSFLRRSEARRSGGIEAEATLIAPYSIDFHHGREAPASLAPGGPGRRHLGPRRQALDTILDRLVAALAAAGGPRSPSRLAWAGDRRPVPGAWRDLHQ